MIRRIRLAAALLASPLAAQMPAPPPQVPRPPAARPAAGGPARAAAVPGAAFKDLKFPASRPLELPQPARFQLANGMKILLLEDHERPSVTVEALVRTGAIFDPPERSGLGALTGSLLRDGGSGRKRPESIDAELESAGASIESKMGDTAASVTLSALKENAAEAMAIFRDVLTAPEFRHDRIDRARAVALASIARRNDDPRQALVREFRTLVYGKGHPLARRPEIATIGRIGRPDIVAFYRRYFFPANTVLTVTGDFDPEAMKGAIETLFGGWKNDQAPVPEFVKAAPEAAPGGFVGFHPSLRETHFGVGLAVGEVNVQDRAALEIAAALLAGGFQSRLTKRSREDLRSISEIRAESVAALGRPALFVVRGLCQATASGDVIQAVVEELQKLRVSEPTEDELRAARETARSAMLAGLDNKPRALSAVAHGEYYGYPPELLKQLYAALGAVTRTDVARVVKERIPPEKLTAVALSNLTVFTKPVDPRGGASKPLDLAIPQPEPEATAVRAAGAEVAKKLLARAQEASGGAEKLAAVKDYVMSASYDLTDGNSEKQTDRWLAPNSLRQDASSTKAGALYRFTDGTSGWLSNGRSSTALTGLLAREGKSEMLRVWFLMLLSDRLPGRTVTALDDETIEIAQDDVSTQVVFDPKTGLPARMLYQVRLERQLPILIEEEYSDYRDVGGVKVPFATTVTHNGVKYSAGAVSEFKINQGLKLEVLQRRP